MNPDWLPGGFIGVDVFLVISGFLITNILLHKKTNTDYRLATTLKYFYTSRFKRIVPAYFTMLIVAALVAAVFFLPQDFSTFKKGLAKAAWFNSNNYFAGFGDYFAPANDEQPLLHTWSLAVEIQFYLLAPLIVILLPVSWLKWVFATVLISLTVLAEYRLRFLGVEQTTYYSLYARLPEFFAGGLVALYKGKTTEDGKCSRRLGTTGLVLIILAAIAQPLLGPFPGIAALLPVAGGALLLSQPASAGLVNKLLSSTVLVWLGALSYSLYLWHWPVLAFLRYYTGSETLNTGLSIFFILLTFSLSMVSYYQIESTFKCERTNKKLMLGWALLAASVFGASQSIAKVNERFTPEQLPIEYRRGVDPATSCHGKIVGSCLRGDLTSNKEVLVLGDSHGNQLNLFFDELGRELGFKARVITGSSCVTIPGFDYQRLPEWARADCLSQIKQGQLYQLTAERVFLVGSWSYHTQSEEFISAFKDYLQSAVLKNKSVYILSQIPRFNQSALRVRRFHFIGLNSHLTLNPRYQLANQKIESIAKKYSQVSFLALDHLPVFDDAPFYNQELIYRDKHHINEVGAKAYAKYALSYFEQLF